jgi:hypothetical protein
MPMENKCEGCAHFFPVENTEAALCRRYPPQSVVEVQGAVFTKLNIGSSPLDPKPQEFPGWKVLSGAYTAFPTVQPNWTCGEFVDAKDDGTE